MWWNLLIGIAFNFIAFLFRPKQEPPRPVEGEDINIPVAKEGREFGKIYGTVWIEDPLVHWYGDFRTIPITKKGGKK